MNNAISQVSPCTSVSCLSVHVPPQRNKSYCVVKDLQILNNGFKSKNLNGPTSIQFDHNPQLCFAGELDISFSTSEENRTSSHSHLSTSSVSPNSIFTVSPSLKSAYTMRRNSSLRYLQRKNSVYSFSRELRMNTYNLNSKSTSPVSSRRTSVLVCQFDLGPNDPLSFTSNLCQGKKDCYFEIEKAPIRKPQLTSNLKIPPLCIGYSIKPKFTCFIDRLQSRLAKHSYTIPHSRCRCHCDIPLETFSLHSEALPTMHENIELATKDPGDYHPVTIPGQIKRCREERVNSKYLLQYAIYTSNEIHGYFRDITMEDIDIFDELLIDTYSTVAESMKVASIEMFFDDCFTCKLRRKFESRGLLKEIDKELIDNLRLASVTRFKLWNTATLHPRCDEIPSINRITDDVYSPFSVETCRVPWLSITDLKEGKAINRLNKKAGLLKGSNIQFVLKNCSSKRWIPTNANSL